MVRYSSIRYLHEITYIKPWPLSFTKVAQQSLLQIGGLVKNEPRSSGDVKSDHHWRKLWQMNCDLLLEN